MLFLHNSLNDQKFAFDKKLNLLKHGVITIGQFVNLIEKHDPYIIIGPAVVDKSKIKEFLEEWKHNNTNAEELSETQNKLISQSDIIDNLDNLTEIFPEIKSLVNEFKLKLSFTNCPKCTKNKYISSIIGTIKPLINDGRDLKNMEIFINSIMLKYYPNSRDEIDSNEFDIKWIKADEFIGLGYDLIKGLNNCFECTKKHIGRAKIFYEEFKLGYPDHEKLMFKELTDSNELLEKAFISYMDAMSQMDMASCELVGNMENLDEGYQADIIELANKIRCERILFQEDPTKIPNFDKLRLDIQKLQNKINKEKKVD